MGSTGPSCQMSGDVLILIELSLFFLLAFGWGFNELRQLKKYDDKRNRRKNNPTVTIDSARRCSSASPDKSDQTTRD